MQENKKLIVINLLAGPGVGKSAAALMLAGRMKAKGFKIEFVDEAAKSLVWESQHHMFTEQDYIFALQHRMIRRLVRHDIDFAVMDTSMLLGLMYMPEWFPKSFKPLLLEVYHTYDNVNIYLERNPEIKYVQEGRNQTLEEALEKDKQVLQFLEDEKLPFYRVMAGDNAANEIFNIVIGHALIKEFRAGNWPCCFSTKKEV